MLLVVLNDTNLEVNSDITYYLLKFALAELVISGGRAFGLQTLLIG